MADALVSNVINQLASVLHDDVLMEPRSSLYIKREIQDVKNTLEAIQPVLADIKQLKSEEIKVWMGKLKDVAYSIEDVLSDWTIEILKVHKGQPKKKKGLFFFSNSIGVDCSPTFDVKIKDIKVRLASLESEKNDFNLVTRSRPYEVRDRSQPGNSQYGEPAEVVGREKDKDTVVRELLQQRGEEEDVHVISILGKRGIGKTTFAQLVYNCDEVTAHFQIKMFLPISGHFDQIKAVKAMAGNDVSYNQALRRVGQLIRGKKLLLVLDDMWSLEHDMWDQFSNILKATAPGSRILVTSLDHISAETLRTTFTHRLVKLSNEDGRNLFKQIAPYGGRQQDSQYFQSIADKLVVDRCCGNPLAIKMLACLLRPEHDLRKWQAVSLRELWEYRDERNAIIPALFLSYDYLPSPVKQCFLYCANFPRDNMKADDLIKVWMAQGYLISGGNHASMEQKGREFLETLSLHSFIHVLERDTDTSNIKILKMHGMIHDFACFLSKKESLVIALPATRKDIEREMDSGSNRVRHLTLIRNRDADFPGSLGNIEKLHTLVVRSFHDCPGLSEIAKTPNNLFNGLKCVKALDLSRNKLHDLPEEVGELLNMRYLNLSHNPLKELPETVCGLYNLQTLKLSGCEHLRELPQGLHKLTNLRHLEIDGTASLKPLPKGIKCLISLQTLSKFIIGNGGAGNDTKEEACTLGDLQNLNSLYGSLKIERLGFIGNVIESKIAKLKEKGGLYNLHMDFSVPNQFEVTTHETTKMVEHLELPIALKRLTITSYGGDCFPKWINFLISLRELRLEDCRHCLCLPPLGKLPGLETLYIEKLNGVKAIGSEVLGIKTMGSSQLVAFPKLKKLVFLKMSNWETWNLFSSEGVTGKEDIRIMPCLSYLMLSFCKKLRELPLPILKPLDKLLIHYCPIVTKEMAKDPSMISHIADVEILPDSIKIPPLVVPEPESSSIIVPPHEEPEAESSSLDITPPQVMPEAADLPPFSSEQSACCRFTLAEIQSATNDFEKSIGEGGFAVVYKGNINNKVVAVKRLSKRANQTAEFKKEIQTFSKIRHCRLLFLIGYCHEQHEMILVYEYMANGSLYDHLHNLKTLPGLPWEVRLRICKDIAAGLCYLHNDFEVNKRILHGDIKSANVLLDENFHAKLSDFGLSTIAEIDQDNKTSYDVQHTRKYTKNYADPEYIKTGLLSRECDVYSFGILLLEMVLGKKAFEQKSREYVSKEKLDDLFDLIDGKLKAQVPENCLHDFVGLALRCCSHIRPKMTKVLSELEELNEAPIPAWKLVDTSVICKEFSEDNGRGYDMSDSLQYSQRSELVSGALKS